MMTNAALCAFAISPTRARRSTTFGARWGSDAWTNVKVSAARARVSAKSTGALPSPAGFHHRPTARRPAGTLTDTRP